MPVDVAGRSGGSSNGSSGCALAGVVLFLVVIALAVWLIVLLAGPSGGGGTGGSGGSGVTWCKTKVELFALIGSKQTVMLAVMSSKCGHCARLRPVYEAAAAKLDGVTVVAIDVSSGDWGDVMRQLGEVEGVPHVVRVEAGDLSRAHVYTGDRSMQSLIDFGSRK